MELRHRVLTNTALPYITNLSPTDPTPRYVDGVNVLTSIKGYLERRPGLTSMFTSAFGQGLIRRLFQWETWTGDFYIFAALIDDAAVFSKVLKYKVGTDADWIVLTAADDATTSEPYDFAVSNNHVFFCNGASRYKYDGTTVTKWGIDAPTSALTLTPGAGSLTGVYRYVIAWLNNTTGHTSSPSPLATVTAAGDDITVTGNTTTDTQVTHVRLYRTATGGSVLFEHPASPIDYATWIGSGYTDSTADTDLDVTTVAPAEHQNDPPPPMKGLEWYQGRLWGFADDKAYHSGWEEIPLGTSDMPEECFPPDNYFPFGKRLSGVAAAGDPAAEGVLCVFSPGVLFHVSGDSLNTFVRGTIAGGIGTRNRATIAKFRKLLAWLDSTNTVQITDGSRVYEISIPIRPDLESINHADAFMFAHTTGSDQWLILALGRPENVGTDRLIVYDLDREQWMPPWDSSEGGVLLNAGASLETAPGVFRAAFGEGAQAVEFSRTRYDDDETVDVGEAFVTTNAMDLPSKPDRLAVVRWIAVERPAHEITLAAKLLVDEDPTSGTFTDLTDIKENPTGDPRRTQGSALIEHKFHTDRGPAGRRAAVQLNWPAPNSLADSYTPANAYFRAYTIDVAYEEIGS